MLASCHSKTIPTATKEDQENKEKGRFIFSATSPKN